MLTKVTEYFTCNCYLTLLALTLYQSNYSFNFTSLIDIFHNDIIGSHIKALYDFLVNLQTCLFPT